MKQNTILFIQVFESCNDYNFCNFYLFKNLTLTRRKNLKINISDIQAFTTNKENSLLPIRIYENSMKPLRFNTLKTICDLLEDFTNLETIILYKSTRSLNNEKFNDYYNRVKDRFDKYKIIEGLDSSIDYDKFSTYNHPTLTHLQNMYNCKLLVDQ
ncbi:MdBV-11 [Microplitis demolitor]|nr:MdBV-11 [Microplitis demolitor]